MCFFVCVGFCLLCVCCLVDGGLGFVVCCLMDGYLLFLLLLGWYDAILIPFTEHKWTFKEGDVAVLSSPKPGSGFVPVPALIIIFLKLQISYSKFSCYNAVRLKRSSNSVVEDDEEAEISGRVAGTVRRHIPIDTRDSHGAILHFYVGDSYDSNRSVLQVSHFLIGCFSQAHLLLMMFSFQY